MAFDIKLAVTDRVGNRIISRSKFVGGLLSLLRRFLALHNFFIYSVKQTIVIEKQDRLGGWAVSNKKKGAYFNLGGHACFLASQIWKAGYPSL